MKQNQAGVVLRFQAKEGKGQELFDLITDLHHTDDPDGPVDWVVSRDDDNANVMWCFEFYRSQDSFDRHYANPVHDEPHQRVFDLLEDREGLDSSMRMGVHIVSCS
ncbi:putative quinol monooxygenase [Rhodococcoides yunnanense]|uniref:Antibiotic biosynthesis monooxygenase family protein n=1 Tax=Rhodococcoides yunnanense TaxID=278209 RepID=A0ABU4B8T6_9NOCA|nr:antibiotic biosynthesis monooxygenase family protein [Rhodococcus yunnanensis]MDV6260599.1 antibiotic biosynthesis monooxygenase family protein [Rhodococcus yunnanensis]